MPLQSQFTLSLELTKLLPLRNVVNAGGRALIALARELQKSGSDIVVEEDLAEIFGRNRLSQQFESTFKNAVRETKVQQLSEFLEIVLEAGAGPTVRRSLKDSRYLSMVAQVALLAWSHNIESLALALHKACQQRLEGAPPEQQNFPTLDGILGTLRACRDQTSGFGWNRLFMAVERALDDIGPNALPRSRVLPYEILRGLLDFLLAVQMLPEDRYIHIMSQEGYVTVVVWAHHLLGLTVTVQMPDKFYRFGTGKEEVHFEYPLDGHPTTICLLDARLEDGGAEVFRISVDEFADRPLDGDMRLSALGYGRSCLEAVVGNNRLILQELAQKVAEYSRITLQQIFQGSASPPGESTQSQKDNNELFLSSPERIFKTACFLFDGLPLDWESFRQDSEHPRNDSQIAQSEVHSQQMLVWLKEQYGPDPFFRVLDLSKWMVFLVSMTCLLTYVLDLKNCEDLPLIWYSTLQAVPEDMMLGIIRPGKLGIFEALARLLLGEKIYDQNFHTASLVSSHGWSLYLPTIGLAEPSNVQPDCVRLARGVPTRFSERKLWIVDAAVNDPAILSDDSYSCDVYPDLQRMFLNTPSSTKYRVFAGPRGAVFEACLEIQASGMGCHRLGFRYLQRLRADFQLLTACEHPGLVGETSPSPEGTCHDHGCRYLSERRLLERLVIGRPDRNRLSR